MMTTKQPFLIEFPPKGTPETGFLSVAEDNSLIPFPVKRIFWTYEVPDFAERGHHAYHHTEQILVVVHGAAKILLESPQRKKLEFELHSPSQGLYLPPLYWRKVKFYDQAVTLVLSSQAYDEADYIRDYQAFRELRHGTA